eukprot:CAMPEP_0116547200 /NCGR_PEP_ID=MMETSP0397-20121206/3645_1 /TAXON_ID=216820 /ORGANISM="Cyclophora tenuis, Strain ECT3854" /LENGTH=133 /DNA_ID=CAMNT_0004071705 /DNA_START=35 /DNA_END=436 /DNA_ORIENTATION=-
MKPAEAAVILEHQIPPADMESKLPSLMDERAKQISTASVGSNLDSIVDSKSSQHSESSDFLSPQDSGSHLTEDGTEIASWYEVVELNDDGAETIHGLFRDRDEANLCLDTKESISRKYEPHGKARFAVRRTAR